MRTLKQKAYDILNNIPGHKWIPEKSESSTRKKQELLALAKSGATRPSWNSILGQGFYSYTNKNSNSYDPKFDKLIRSLRPDWFENKTVLKKQELLALAKSGKARPSSNTSSLGLALFTYTNKYSSCYDPKFDKLIRSLRPDWFEKSAETKKQELLALAKSGAVRPGSLTSLGSALNRYTTKNSSCYDPKFDKLIRSLRPDWFEKSAEIKKQELLALAKSGTVRPKKTSFLGSALHRYINKSSNSYDPEFDKLIRSLRPDWFESKLIKANLKKQELLALAKSGKAKPNRNTSLGQALCNYTNKHNRSYDPEFDKEIRSLRPDWFVNPSNKSDIKKQEILALAKSGAVRPSCKTSLGRAVNSYTTKNGNSYDPEFDKEIRKLRPDWFKRKTS